MPALTPAPATYAMTPARDPLADVRAGLGVAKLALGGANALKVPGAGTLGRAAGAVGGGLQIANAVETGNVAQGVGGGLGLAASVAPAAWGPYLSAAGIGLGLATQDPYATTAAIMGAANPVLGLASSVISYIGQKRDAATEKKNVQIAKRGLATFQGDPDVQNLRNTLGAAKRGDPGAVASVQRALAAAMKGADALTHPSNSNPNALAPYFKAIYNSVIGTPAFGPTVIAAAKALGEGPWDQGYERQVSYAYDRLNEQGFGSPAFYGPPPGYDPNLGTGRGLAEARVRSMAPATSTPRALPNIAVTDPGASPPPGYARGSGMNSGLMIPTAFPAVPGMEPPAGFTRGSGMNSGQFVPRLSGGAFGTY